MKLSEQRIYLRGLGSNNTFLEGIKNIKFKVVSHFHIEEQLDYAKKIAGIDDKEARELALSILSAASLLHERLNDATTILEDIERAVVRIDEGYELTEKEK